MATLTITPIKTFISGETVTPAKLNELGQSTVALTAGTIVDADISASAAIAGSKLAGASVTQAKLGANVVGNGPAFRAWASGTTSLPNNVETKVNLATEDFDTNNNFSNSRFTPSVAGYYQINAAVYVDTAPALLQARIFKNGSAFTGGSHCSQTTLLSNCSDLIYMNGTTDYVEFYAVQASGATRTVTSTNSGTFMSGFLARAA